MQNENVIDIIEQDIKKAKDCLEQNDYMKMYDTFCNIQQKYRNDKEYEWICVSTFGAYDFNTQRTNYEKYKKYLKQLVDNLELLRAKLKDEKEKTDNKANINITTNNSNTANSTINQNFDFKTTIKNINKIPNEILDEKLKTELRSILADIDTEDNTKNKKEKFMKAIKWLGDKSVDVAIQILPYLAGIKF